MTIFSKNLGGHGPLGLPLATPMSIATDLLMLLFTNINVSGLPLSACHCLAALTAKMCAFNSLMEQNACYRNIK